jgi:sarcosine oxidase delta subunit
VRIELIRSRCGAVTPEGPARAFPTPPSLPPPSAAKVRAAIGLTCPVPILHIECPFSARVDSRDGSLQEYDGSMERNKPRKVIRKSRERFSVYAGNRRQARCQARMSWSRTDYCVPERSTPTHDTRSTPGRSRLRDGSISDLKRPVEFADLE